MRIRLDDGTRDFYLLRHVLARRTLRSETRRAGGSESRWETRPAGSDSRTTLETPASRPSSGRRARDRRYNGARPRPPRPLLTVLAGSAVPLDAYERRRGRRQRGAVVLEQRGPRDAQAVAVPVGWSERVGERPLVEPMQCRRSLDLVA